MGALYLLLVIATSTLWVHSNLPSEPLNLWRLYLVMMSATGALYAFASPLPGYFVVGLVFMVFAWAHMHNSHRWGDWQFIGTKLLVVVVVFLLATLFIGPSLLQLVVILLGIFFTYVPVGQRLWMRATIELDRY